MKLQQKHFQQRQWIPGKELVDWLLSCLDLSDFFLSLKHFLGLLLIYNVVFNFHWTAKWLSYILSWSKCSFGFFCKIVWKNPNELFSTIYIHIYVCIYMYIHIYECVCVCVYIYIYILSQVLFHYGFHRILNIFPYTI